MDWNDLKKKLSKITKDMHAAAIVSANEISNLVSSSDWFGKFNEYTSEVSKAMDSEFLLSLKQEVGQKMAPSYHRIVDGGHDFFSSLERAREIGEKNGWSDTETFSEWAKSYFTDLTSPAGMPAFGKFSEDIYSFLKEMGFSEEVARDVVTVNGQEFVNSILSGTIAFLAVYFAWKKKDQEAFSKTIASLVVTSAVTLNPMILMVALISLAFGYQKLVNKEAFARGAITSGAGLLVSAMIPGPLLIGALPAIMVSIYLGKKMGSDFMPLEFTKSVFVLLKSEQFREKSKAYYDELFKMVGEKAA